MENRLFMTLWDQLRIKKSQYAQYLDQITIQNLRGISDLSINFNYPVTVIAGPNASGKSTVLFSCACAYDPIGAKSRLFTPVSLFPNLTLDGDIKDFELQTSFSFNYTVEKRKMFMRWAKGKSWNKSYGGQKNTHQPKREVYFRTLANLTRPSEVRSVLQISSANNVNINEITSDLIAFAQRILPLQYKQVKLIKKDSNELLFVNSGDAGGQKYSEFHMSAGERAILRISKDISNMKNALILMDEIEAGLHPFTQRQLMLELQRIALRNDLQIIVTSHSPVILDSVPPDARVFLERTENNVIEKPAYKDIIQKALYGQSTEKLSLLCEDEMGEHFILGILDYLNPKLNIVHDDIKVGRDTGKEEFPNHIHALGKFNKLSEFIFVLDGDAREMETKLKAAGIKCGMELTPLFLPGNEIPESWGWKVLSDNVEDYAHLFGVSSHDLNQRIMQSNLLYDNATDKDTIKNKNKFHALCEHLRREKTEIIRAISRKEVEKQVGDMKIFADEMELQIETGKAENDARREKNNSIRATL